MKRKLLAVISMILAVLMLASCASSGTPAALS